MFYSVSYVYTLRLRNIFSHACGVKHPHNPHNPHTANGIRNGTDICGLWIDWTIPSKEPVWIGAPGGETGDAA